MQNFIKAPEVEVTVVTRRDVFQAGAREEYGPYSKEYRELSAVVDLSERDMKDTRVKDGSLVELISASGSVVACAHKSDKVPKGMAVMPAGPWANVLVPGDGDVPAFKRVNAIIKSATKQVQSLEDLLP